MRRKPDIKLQAVTYRSRLGFSLGPITHTFPVGATAVLGRNGSGKSTLLRLLAHLLPPDSGTLEFSGRNQKNMAPTTLAQQLCWISTHHHFAFDQSVRDTLVFGRYPWHQGYPKQQDEEAIDQALERLGISHLKPRSVREISSGEMHKVHLARALCSEAKYLILDEPSASLDVPATREVFAMLAAEAAQKQQVVIIATHDLLMAKTYCRELLLIRKGQLVAAHPSHEFSVEQLSDLIASH